MSGAKIIFAPRLADIVFEAVPFGEDKALCVADVKKLIEKQQFREYDLAHVQRCFHRLARKDRMLLYKWIRTPNGQKILYWRDPLTAPASAGQA